MTPSPDEKTEAKACPFCDKEPTIIKAFDKPVAVCQSEGCALAGFWVVLEQWNRRTPAQAADVDKVLAEQQAEIERLQESYSRLLVKAAETEQQRDDFWQRLHSLIEAIPVTAHHSTLGSQMRAAIEWIRKSQSLTASLERVKELEKENGRLESEIKNGVIRWHNEVADLDQRNDRLAKECNERLAKQREAEAKVEDLEQTLALMGVDRNEQGEMRCRVCGWKLVANTDEGCVKDNCSQRPAPERRYDEPARYSTDLMLAFAVVERMRERGIRMAVETGWESAYVVYAMNGNKIIGAGFLKTESLDDLPRQICLAAKQALEQPLPRPSPGPRPEV